MSRATIGLALPPGDRLLLDTTTLIAYLNGGEAVSPIATYIIDDLVRTGRNRAIISPITVMEVLVRPLRQGPGGPYRHVLDFLTNFPHLDAMPIDLHVAQEAAAIRATYNFRPPDALVIATGIVAQVGYIVTNDDEWRRKLRLLAKRIEVCYLADHLPFP